MKRSILFLAVALLACGQTFAQEELSDAGMNNVGANGQLGSTPNPPWVLTAQRGANLAFDDGAASEAFADVDGGGFGLFFKAFVGNPPWDPTAGDVDVQIYQDVDGTPGMKYVLTGWWGAQNNWSGLNTPGANAIFALDFYNGAALIGSAELDLEAAGLGDPSTTGTELDYKNFMVMAIAPAGTTTVRARGEMIDGAFFQDPGQALVTDAWSLRCVPEPSTALLGGLALLGLVIRKR